MKTNIALMLDAALLRKIRAVAAERGLSISELLAPHFEQIVQEHKSYQRARQRALTRLRNGVDLHWTPPRFRSELHER